MQHKKQLTRFTIYILLVIALLVGTTGIVLAFPSGDNPGAIGPNTITWTGQGASNGVLNTSECDATSTPYLLWIFTTDGGSVDSNPAPMLTLGGTGSGTYADTNPSSNSAWHFTTPYFKPDGNLTAKVDFSVAETGNGAWNLVISHGCAPAAKDLTVTKTATPSFTRTFDWTITKTADKTTVYSAGGGVSDPVTYTVAVAKDSGTDSDFAVSGTITVHNPNPFDVNGVSLSDGACTVTPAEVNVPAGGDVTAAYVCGFGANPGSGTNTATAVWPEIGSPNTSATGSAGYTFGDPTQLVNDAIAVTDTNGQSWNFTASGSKTYQKTFTDPAGTCTAHENTATILGLDKSASVTVKDCQGADPTVEKTAVPSYDLTYAWDITKSVIPAYAEVVPGKLATFNYTVGVTHDAGTASHWVVSGKITLSNPNDWEALTVDVSDNLCAISGGTGVVIPANGSVELPYACAMPNGASGTNIATATWDAAAYHTPNHTASGSAGFTFGEPTHVIDACVTVTDTNLVDPLGTVCVGDANPTTFTYALSFLGPDLGACVDYPNTATFTTNDSATTGSDSAKVTVCTYNARLTPGYWKNHLVYDPKTPQNPWVEEYLPLSLNGYVVSTTAQATAIFNGMNCGSSTDQGAVGCLAGHLLAAKLNVANHANPSIQPTIDAADAFLTSINYVGPAGKYTLTAEQRSLAISLKSALDAYNNGK